MNNDRHLVSRNKREGWYAGKEAWGWGKPRHHRSSDQWDALRYMNHWRSL